MFNVCPLLQCCNTGFDESRYILRRNASFCTVKPFTVHEELRPVRPTKQRRRAIDGNGPHKRRSRFDRYRKEFKLPKPREGADHYWEMYSLCTSPEASETCHVKTLVIFSLFLLLTCVGPARHQGTFDQCIV